MEDDEFEDFDVLFRRLTGAKAPPLPERQARKPAAEPVPSVAPEARGPHGYRMEVARGADGLIQSMTMHRENGEGTPYKFTPTRDKNGLMQSVSVSPAVH